MIDTETDQVLRFAAVIGGSFEKPLLRHVVHRAEDSLDRMLHTATSSGVLRAEATRYRFRDNAIRLEFYRGLDEAVRCGVHRRVAVVLKSTGADAARIAHHLVAALPYSSAEEALRYTLEAGRASLDHSEAVALFAQALKLVER
ncbi:hypothetical protein FKR81_04500 [Lentzea tibetensis]|uniref:Uncharacterized protein n=1 Tax=Lentzea tibetensis TaxID=2591470 RepID=A0A563EZU1_9PSEU|nr:hypothetical protein [Lentzea tibetensis]TWP53235.1 hypothetical protein FKR81_04500 [Lentzea tibetensis]